MYLKFYILAELNKKIRWVVEDTICKNPLINYLRFEVLLITGLRSRYVADTEVIHKEMAPGTCSMIKVAIETFD